MPDTRQHYDRLYRLHKGPILAFGLPETELLRFLDAFPFKSADIADLCCGDGRHALELARRGYNVMAVDNSIAALEKIEKYGLSNIKTAKADITKSRLAENSFDLVMCVFSFHELGLEGMEHIIHESKLATKLDGINYHAFFALHEGTYMRRECHYPDEAAVLHLYNDWRIIRRSAVLMTHTHITPDSGGKGDTHQHYACHLFLQKPSL